MVKLFLGGVNPNTSSDAVREHFSKFGPVADAVVMRDRGFGFVTFETREAADAALSEPQQHIDGQKVDVKEAQGKGGRGGGGGRDAGGGRGGDSGVRTDKVFVGGLPQDCPDDKIRNYFEAYGVIVDAVVMKDRETGRSRGFGFVQFDNPAPVEKVMEDYSIHKIEGKWVEVKRSVPRDQMPPAPQQRGGGGGYGGHRQGRDGGGGGERGPPACQGGKGACGGYGGYPYGGAYVGGAYGGYPGGGYGGYPGGYPYGYPGGPPGGYPGYGMPPPGAYGYGDPYAGGPYGAGPYGPPPGGCPPPGGGKGGHRSSPY